MTSAPLPLLVVGHGTRSDEGVAEFTRLMDRIAARAAEEAGADTAGGFIELAPPPVQEAVAALVGRGHRELATVPLVLVAAGHGKGDIPAAMAREQVRHPGLRYRYGRPLGPHPALLTLLERRVDEALAGAPHDGVTVVLVGRGSSDPDANAEIAKVARLLYEGRGYADVLASFVSLAQPSVPAALERARLLGARRVVVAPYFLFPGVLPDRIVAQGRAFGEQHPGVEVAVAEVLGDSDELAGLVLERYREAVGGDLRMNCDTCVYRIAMPGFEDKVGAPQRPHDHPDDPTGGHGHAHTHGHAHGHSH